jgi:general secretion pathway protein D
MPDTVFASGARRSLRRGAILAALVCVGGLALAQQQARSPQQVQQGQQAIRPNFRDADITSIIDAVAMTTGRSFIVDPRVRAQVTMYSNATMSPEQFYQAFLAILQVHGFVAVPAGNVIKIIPDANMRQMPGNDLPAHVSATSDEIVTQVMAVKNVSAATLVPILRPLQSTNGQISAVTGANMLIISDHAANVSRLERIIERIDQVGNSDVDVISLQSATAADTARVLNSLITQTGDAGTAVKIVADDRSNSILVSGDSNQRLRIRTLIANLDTPVDSGSETQVRYLRYAAAEDLASKLKEQLSGSSSSSTSQAGRNQTAVAQPQPNTQGNTGPLTRPEQAAPTTAAGAATISLAGGTATIWADKDTNALIITAAQRTMRAVNAVIDKLDIRRPQVAIEALIVEVSADKTADLGVNWALDGSATNVGVGGFISPIGGSSIVDLYSAVKSASSGTATTSPPTGTTVGIGRLQATGVNFAAILRAVAGDSRTNILQHPQVVTRDNQEAKMEVAQEVPFLTGQYTTTNGTGSAFQTIQRQEVGTILTVTPQINEGDAVLLKIQIESSSIAGSSQGAVDLITNKRTISTSVLIKDGGTLVLGGLISDTATNSEQRVPGLGRIPLIGELFRTRDTSKNKSDLLIFIQPRILRDDNQTIIETDAKYQYLRQEQRELNRENTIIPAQPFQKTPILPADIKDAPIAPTIDAKPVDGGTPAASGPKADSTAPSDNAPANAGPESKSP